MQVIQDITELQCPPHHKRFTQWTSYIILLLLQRLPLDVFHHQVGLTTFLKEITHIRQVRMFELYQQISLVPKVPDCLNSLTRVERRITHLLDCDHTLRLEAFISRFVDRSKATFPNQLDDTIATTQQIAEYQCSCHATSPRTDTKNGWRVRADRSDGSWCVGYWSGGTACQ